VAARRADTTLVTVPLVGVLVEREHLVFPGEREESFAICSAAAAGESGRM
jgi:hypothetical protein